MQFTVSIIWLIWDYHFRWESWDWASHSLIESLFSFIIPRWSCSSILVWLQTQTLLNVWNNSNRSFITYFKSSLFLCNLPCKISQISNCLPYLRLLLHLVLLSFFLSLFSQFQYKQFVFHSNFSFLNSFSSLVFFFNTGTQKSFLTLW